MENCQRRSRRIIDSGFKSDREQDFLMIPQTMGSFRSNALTVAAVFGVLSLVVVSVNGAKYVPKWKKQVSLS